MKLDFSSEKPIYLQLAEGLEDAILSGAFPEGEQVPSTTEISVTYQINPATALKGINLLVANGILYKKRGVGMFVSPGAKEQILKQRQDAFYQNFILPLVSEAHKLELSKGQVLELLGKGFDHE